MKIKELKISNLMSFPYVANFDDFDLMNFDKLDKGTDMNILI
jgi:hypothetical protein